MPAQYTHQLIAERTLAALPAPLREKISSFAAFCLGAQGGDVFYFLRVRGGKGKNFGRFMHSGDVFSVFESFYEALLSRPSAQAFSYVAGYISHYAADTLFHPFVYGLMERFAAAEPRWKGKRHVYIESDLDSHFIAAREGIPVSRYKSPVRRAEISLDELYPLLLGVSERAGRVAFSRHAFRCAVRRFFFFEKLCGDRKGRRRAFWNGTERLFRLPHVFSLLCRRDVPDARCLNREEGEWRNPSAPDQRSCESADALFDRAVAEGARLIALFADCLERGAPLPREEFSKGFLTAAPAGVKLVTPAPSVPKRKKKKMRPAA